MLNLVIKDIFIQKRNFIYIFLYVVFISICFSSNTAGMGLYVLGPIITTYLFAYNVVNYDDKNKSEIILNSLPITREEIVKAKYISTFVYAIIGIMYATIIGSIAKLIGFSVYTMSTSLFDIFIIFIAVCIFSAVFFPVYFKFGAIKARIFNTLLFMIIFFAPITAVEYAAKNPNNNLVQKMNYFINSTSSLLQYSLVIVIGLTILLISLLISLRIYKNKEF